MTSVRMTLMGVALLCLRKFSWVKWCRVVFPISYMVDVGSEGSSWTKSWAYLWIIWNQTYFIPTLFSIYFLLKFPNTQVLQTELTTVDWSVAWHQRALNCSYWVQNEALGKSIDSNCSLKVSDTCSGAIRYHSLRLIKETVCSHMKEILRCLKGPLKVLL